MSVLASSIMNSSRLYLNDVGATYYTNTVLLPYVSLANKELQDKLLVFGVEIPRVVSAPIDVAALATTLTLPTDFFIPVRLFERADGDTDNSWIPMTPKMWEPESMIPTNILTYWAYRNDNIYFVGATSAREVKLEYERSLAAIATNSDPIDSIKFERFLAAITAEKAARYIGMNNTHADTIRDNECLPAGYELMQYLTLNAQDIRQRRPQFTSRKRFLVQ